MNLTEISALLFFLILPMFAESQDTAPQFDCNGILITYSLTGREKIRPFLKDPLSQPYSFKSTAFVVNQGKVDLKDWSLLIDFQNKELLVSATNSVLNNNSPFPFNTSDSDGPASFSGYPNSALKTPIETANDLSQIQSEIKITGTFFGSPLPANPLPKSISIDDPLFICPPPTRNSSTLLHTCCTLNPKPDKNNTDTNSSDINFLPRRKGDLSIFYDVLQTYKSSYLAQVEISNGGPLSRLDNWKLSWEWMRGEFIYSIKGAYSALIDQESCIMGKQGQYYQDLDFSKVVTCVKTPKIMDLPLSRYNDTEVGKIPFCCRNGTILPEVMDPSQTKSRFQMNVFKMPPDLNRTTVYPPQNFQIVGGLLNPTYKCGQPIRVSPTLYPDPSGLDLYTSSLATWQVVCNITRPKRSSPKCCVSFSAFYNDSVVPCRTCACGCNNVGKSCNGSARAMLQPPEAMLVPYANRTEKMVYFAKLKHYNIPNPLPCADYCGVSVNWHVNSDYRLGWSARVTLFNWENYDFANWFAAVDLGKAYKGYEKMYSFNGSGVGNGMVFMQGLPGLNYLTGEVDGKDPHRDPRVPGKQQSVISFTKKKSPGLNVAGRDGFPKRVWFNGEECAMPDMIPTSFGVKSGVGMLGFVLVMTVIGFVM